MATPYNDQWRLERWPDEAARRAGQREMMTCAQPREVMAGKFHPELPLERADLAASARRHLSLRRRQRTGSDGRA